MHYRPCFSATSPLPTNSPSPTNDKRSVSSVDEPIRVSPKKKGRKSQNIFFDNRGYPDQSNDYDYLINCTTGGKFIRKRKHPARPLTDIDPLFHSPFIPSLHQAVLNSDLKIDHLSVAVGRRLSHLVQKYWSVFDTKGLHVPVKDYECCIDTGNHRPIAVKNIHYGPREIPIMQKHIDSLLKLGHIKQIHDGQWLFKALLAAKPHQEHITTISAFIWRFCVNYIPLNQITRIIAYPIPRCDLSVSLAFGDGKWFWLMDAPQGYHQLRVEKNSQEKLAFAGPNATKFTWNVMPFGPVNGPPIFIMFMHDMNGTWQDVARDAGVTIDANTNTNLIVDDCFSWASDLDTAFKYMECQLQVCLSQNLSLNLKKCHFFPQRVEFVGIDVSPDGNRPAQSKHQLLATWPYPTIVRDISSFVGFANFYQSYMPNFELRIVPLRAIINAHDLSEPIGDKFSPEAKAAFDDIRQSILSDPCLKRFNHRRRLYLKTDFSSYGFGYVAMQPSDNAASLSAMRREMEGGPCEFLLLDESLQLHPIAFGSRKTRGYETKLHSHLGEGFAGDWAINRCRHYCYGMRFTWITDCYGIKFILSYDGTNAVLQRLQMRLMCWDMDIIHRSGPSLGDADYWSRLGVDVCFDPLLRDYVQRIQQLRQEFPAPTTMPMQPENMPGFRGPRLPKQPHAAPTDASAMTALSDIFNHNCHGHVFIENVPVVFERSNFNCVHNSFALHNDHLPIAARHFSQFDWVVYGFNNGHFINSIRKRDLPFNVVLACDPHEPGRALFREFTNCTFILQSLRHLLDHVRSAPSTSVVNGYLLHSPRFLTIDSTRNFWKMQASVITQLRQTRELTSFVAFVHPDNDQDCTDSFCSALRRLKWIITQTSVYFPDIGDSIASSSSVLCGVHSSVSSSTQPIKPIPPPYRQPFPVAQFLWKPFNTREMAVSFSRDDKCFNTQAMGTSLKCTSPSADITHTSKHFAVCKYQLHRDADNPSIFAGSQVYSVDDICPPFNASGTANLFHHYFGVEYPCDGHTFVRPISPFEFASCFRLCDELTYRLSHSHYEFYLDSGIPALTSLWIFDCIYHHLSHLRDANCEIFDPSQHAAPAAPCHAFLNGAVGTKLPDTSRWKQAYADDPECVTITRLVNNPSTICKATLEAVHHKLRQPLRKSAIIIECDMLVLQEPLHGCESFVKLRIVPRDLRNVIFIAFHSNPIGGHFNSYRTYSRMRLRYFWPGMYQYCCKMCAACPACALANGTVRRSRELLYSFPIDAPFKVLHVDIYQAGSHSSFEGSTHYLVGACGMTTFAVMEPTAKANSTMFASSIMKIMMRFGLCHTIVLDKDSKFFSVFRQTVDLLKINCHVLSGDNHNPMIIERINRYLNKGLTVLCNERDSVRVAQEAILLLLYAWNSAPIPGTDLSRSLVAIGREFSFPIDYSTSKHFELTSTPATVVSFAKDQAMLLEASRKIAAILVDEQRSYHRELVNSSRPDPRVYSIGDIVFARRAVRSDAKVGRVDKLMYAHTGPWRVVAKLDGSSYRLQHCHRQHAFEKKHAAHLSPYPITLIPFEPLDGPDTQFGQLHRPIRQDPFTEAGVKGFLPIEPFKLPVNFISAETSPFHWPSLAELNDELFPFPWTSTDERLLADDLSSESLEVLYTGPPPTPPCSRPFLVPAVSDLVASIINSSDRLFFIAWAIPGSIHREWRLIRVAFSDSVKLYPSCLQDGRFLVEFYVAHHDDTRYNAINQRFWLQYHKQSDVVVPSSPVDCHLIRPSPTSETYALQHDLVPFRQWINLSHVSSYVHGPFAFTTINGRRTRDRISLDDWAVLRSQASRFTNTIPKPDLPTYSVHVDRSIHVTFQSKSITTSYHAARCHPASAQSAILLTKGLQ